MTTAERDAAWREYANELGRLNVQGESMETAEIDFKAGFDAAARSLDNAPSGGPPRRATKSKRSESARDSVVAG